jgi:hypothetical protein
MTKQRFNKELLDKCIIRDGATLIGKYDKLNRDCDIKFLCSCKCVDEQIKKFRLIYENGGMFCQKCTAKNKTNKKIETTLVFYGVEHACQSTGTKEKIKQTNLKKYGVEHPLQSKDIREKGKETMLQKYGVDNPMRSKVIKEDSRKTCLEKYGVEYSLQSKDIREKGKKTMLKNYGVEHNFQAGELRDKRKETFLEKYGVEHPAQSQEVMERTQKNAKRYKEFVMPSGTIVKVQGYESYALTNLLTVYSEEQIKVERKNVPRIQYEADGKKRYHFPDIFIPHENKIVEVKSTWTYKCKADNVLAKKNACEEQGYVYEIWVYDGKGRRVEV